MRHFILVCALVSGLSIVGGATAAAQTCYPGACKDADAAILAINAPASLDDDFFNTVEIEGQNVGPTDTVTKSALRPKGKKRVRARVKPRAVKLWVPAGDTYSVFFGVKPARPNGTSKFRGCTRAKPTDANSTNNCFGTQIPNSN